MDEITLMDYSTSSGRRFIIKKMAGWKTPYMTVNQYFAGYVQVLPTDHIYNDVKNNMDSLDLAMKYPQLNDFTIGGITHLGPVISTGDELMQFVGFDTLNRYSSANEHDIEHALILMAHEIERLNAERDAGNVNVENNR